MVNFVNSVINNLVNLLIHLIQLFYDVPLVRSQEFRVILWFFVSTSLGILLVETSRRVIGQRQKRTAATARKHRKVIEDNYHSLEQVSEALRTAGLEASQLILGIDYTKSNQWTGKHEFGGKCLHAISSTDDNPYQKVIKIIGRTLESFDDDKLIPVFGFGDSTTTNSTVFPFYTDRSCHTFREVLTRYNELTPHIIMSGPTNFAPLIYQAIETVSETRTFHILLIITDGEVTDENATKNAIIEASNYPLSIVVVGVGDGPFTRMQEYDDELPTRKFDNFQFVNYHEIIKLYSENPDVMFALNALMELPEQYKEIRKLGLM